MVAMLMMKLFPPGVDTLEANNVELDKNQVQAVLQIVGEQSPNALETLDNDLEIFFTATAQNSQMTMQMASRNYHAPEFESQHL